MDDKKRFGGKPKGRDDENKINYRKDPASSPRLKHGTRVSFSITCNSCGKDDTLPFVPRTEGEMLCSDCAHETFGETWARGRQDARQPRYETECSVCNIAMSFKFKPSHGGPVICDDCSNGIEKSNPQRLMNAEYVGKDGAVRIKRRRTAK